MPRVSEPTQIAVSAEEVESAAFTPGVISVLATLGAFMPKDAVVSLSFGDLIKSTHGLYMLPPYEHSDLRTRFPQHNTCYDPPLAVLCLKNCLINNDGYVLIDGKIFVSDVGYAEKRDASLSELVSAHGSGQYSSIEDPIVFVGSDSNFYHWHLNWFPRLSLTQRFPDLRGMPIYIRNNPSLLVYDSIDLWFGPQRIKLRESPGRVTHVDTLYLPVFFANPIISPFALRGYNTDARFRRGDNLRRVFILRGNARARRVLNEDVVLDIAKFYGFEGVHTEKLTYKQEVELFSSTSHIIGAFGAGLTNMVFAPRGFSVIELDNEYFSNAYWSLAVSLGADRFVRCPPEKVVPFSGTSNPIIAKRDGDFVVDTDLFRQRLETLVR